MSERPYKLLSEQPDLVFGNLRDGPTPGKESCWRMPRDMARDGMYGLTCIFLANCGHPRTDNGMVELVVSGPRYLRNEELPYYHMNEWDARAGRWSGMGAHARADELYPIEGHVDIVVDD